MSSQPSPDVSKPNAEAIRSCVWLAGIIITGVVSLVAWYLMTPQIVRSHRNVSQTQAISNARQLGLALIEFEAIYGKFPDASTIGSMKQDAANPFLFGTTTSNQFFRQLIASEILQTESPFYARIKGAKSPDGNCAGAKALEAGECGFSYLLGAIPSDKFRPLIITPLAPGTTRFDRKQFESGKAVILFTDLTARSFPINEDGDVILNGKKLFDPTNPIWDGRPPVIAWPE